MGKQQTIKVVRLQWMTPVHVVEIENSLQSLQSEVDGYIEAVYYHGLSLICNEEGKLRGLRKNRALYENAEKQTGMYDIICGTFLVVNVDEEGENIDVTDEQIALAENYFRTCVLM